MSRVAIREVPYSLAFNGTTQYGKVTAVPFANATKVTILCWAKLVPVLAASAELLEMSTSYNIVNGFTLYQNTTGTAADSCNLGMFTEDITHALAARVETTPLSPGVWYRVCATIDQTVPTNQQTIFINGVENTRSRPINNNLTSGIATNDMYVGMRAGSSQPFNGNLIVDHVITGKAFTAAEALSEYLTGAIPAGGTPLLTYPMNEGSGTVVTDTSGNGKNIALTNAPVWTNDTPMHARPIEDDACSILSGVQLWCESDRPDLITMVGGKVDSVRGIGRSDGRALKAPSAGVRPLMIRDAGGPAILHDGVSQYLACAFTLPQPSTVFIVYKSVTLGAASVHDIVFDGGQFYMTLISDNTPASALYQSVGLSAPIIANGAYAYAALTFNGASSTVRANGVQTAAGNVGTSTAGGFTIAALHDGTRSTNIAWKSIVVTNTVPSAAELAAWEARCRGKYGL